MINSLVIAPTFLRSSCAVGQIERHLLSSLTSNHYSHILCSSNYDLELCNEYFNIHRIPENKIPHFLNRIYHRLQLTDLSYSPDPFYYSWNKRAYNEAVKIIENNEIDYVLSINNPVSSHLLGLKLKRQFNLPWVAYMFDPWHNNPFRKYHFSYFNRIDETRERSVAENADMLWFPNNELLESWTLLYGDQVKQKSFVLPFATNVPKISDVKVNNEKLIISHIGNLSENRRLNVFLKALSILRRKNPQNLKQLQLNVVGYISDLDKDVIKREKLEDIVKIVGHVHEAECTKYYEMSDLFLIIDIDCDPNLFYPSKLLKYFCYKKPIIGIAVDNSVVACELTKTGNHVFKYDDPSSLSDFLARLIIDPTIAYTNDTEYYKQFLSENVSQKYIELLKKII